MDPLLRVFNLSKRFGTLTAIHHVSFDVYPGEVVGLAGRSGAGKSVLAMLLAGLYSPEVGDIYFAEQRLPWPFQARKLGIEVIHQRPNLAENLSITSNIFLGNEIGWPKMIKWLKAPNERRMEMEANRILFQLGVRFNSLEEKVSNLSSEQRQLVAIARAIACPTRLIFADEPTGLLSYTHQQQFLSLIQTWQQQGISIIFSSKNLEHLFAVADRIIALRDGRLVADHRTDETSREEMVAALVGSADRRQLTPAIWALDSYYQAREQAEKLRHQQTLLEQNLAAQDTLNQQLIDQRHHNQSNGACQRKRSKQWVQQKNDKDVDRHPWRVKNCVNAGPCYELPKGIKIAQRLGACCSHANGVLECGRNNPTCQHSIKSNAGARENRRSHGIQPRQSEQCHQEKSCQHHQRCLASAADHTIINLQHVQRRSEIKQIDCKTE
jgi:ABC-type multidrug transport system ATPase subunit